MESALTPREIQARIRAGESAYEVAQAAGLPLEKIEPFAEPVLAEREHMAELARGCQVRRALGEPGSHRPLIDVIADRLTSRGIFPDTLDWDAWRGRDRLWTIRVAYRTGSGPQEGLFTFDQRGRFSVPANREARWLIGAAPDPHPTRRRRANEPDDEPTLDFQDDSVPSRGRPADPIDIALDAAQLPMGSAYDLGQDALSEPPDFSPARLAEVDGVYDIVPTPGSDMDVLFDMLADLDEDSVNLYEDITGRIAPAAHAPVPAKPAAKPATSPKAKTSRTKAAEPVTPKPQPAARTSRTRTPSVPSKPDVPAEPLVETTLVEQAVVEDVVIQQPDAQAPVVDQAAAPKARKSRKRAVVPSAWDDILFGTRKND